jgi:hypothetical protein
MVHDHLLAYQPGLPVFFNFALPTLRWQFVEQAVKLLIEKKLCSMTAFDKWL